MDTDTHAAPSDQLGLVTEDGLSTSPSWWDRVCTRGAEIVLEKDREGETPVTLVLATCHSKAEAGTQLQQLLPYLGRRDRSKGIRKGREEGTVKIWLDDTRDPSEWLPYQRWFRDDPTAKVEDWTWMRTAPEVIAWLEAGAPVDEVSLDHDLGDAQLVGEGEDVLDWIDEQVVTTSDYEPPIIHIHSGNAPAHDAMDRAVAAIRRHLDQR